MIADLAYVVLGLAGLVVGGDYLVRGAVSLAIRLGVAPVIVGLTVLAFGTSAPELLVSVSAALSGAPGIAIGNVVGSNIANILIILGATALIAPVRSSDPALIQSWAYAVAASGLLILLCVFAPLVWWHGAVLLGAYALVLFFQIRQSRGGPGQLEGAEAIEGHQSWVRTGLWLLIGLVALPIGAKLLVAGATDIARNLGLSEAVIGLTLVAIGTSLPELAASVASAMKGRADMALGNVIGSNLSNILSIIGVTAFFGPLPIPDQMLRFDLWFMLATTLLIGPFLLRRIAMTRMFGAGLLAAYAAYVIWLLI